MRLPYRVVILMLLGFGRPATLPGQDHNVGREDGAPDRGPEIAREPFAPPRGLDTPATPSNPAAAVEIGLGGLSVSSQGASFSYSALKPFGLGLLLNFSVHFDPLSIGVGTGAEFAPPGSPYEFTVMTETTVYPLTDLGETYAIASYSRPGPLGTTLQGGINYKVSDSAVRNIEEALRRLGSETNLVAELMRSMSGGAALPSWW